jgi:hypothetical protein
LAVTLLAAKVAPIILEALVMRLDDSLLLLWYRERQGYLEWPQFLHFE